MFLFAQEQYRLVREARAVLFDYCKTVSNEDFLRESSSFGRGGSIRNLLVHIANTYEFWIGKWALEKNMVFTDYGSKQTMDDISELFRTIDILMGEFMVLLQQLECKKVEYEIKGIKNEADPFLLFSHVITHEFHHKGQILSLSRHWGYTPVDTDIMR